MKALEKVIEVLSINISSSNHSRLSPFPDTQYNFLSNGSSISGHRVNEFKKHTIIVRNNNSAH
jgi:hypothetical protein